MNTILNKGEGKNEELGRRKGKKEEWRALLGFFTFYFLIFTL